MPSYKCYSAVNGQSCSYAKLKTYANCARAEVVKVVVPVPAAAPVTPKVQT